MRGGAANGRDGGDGGGGFVAATNIFWALPAPLTEDSVFAGFHVINSLFLSPPPPPPRTSASYSNGLSVKVELWLSGRTLSPDRKSGTRHGDTPSTS